MNIVRLATLFVLSLALFARAADKADPKATTKAVTTADTKVDTKVDPKTITILSATITDRREEVSDIVRKFVDGDSLTLTVNEHLFRALPNIMSNPRLTIKYSFDGKEQTVVGDDQVPIQIGPRITSYYQKGKFYMVRDMVKEYAAKNGDLIILQAIYGMDDDKREYLQSRVVNNKLTAKVQDWEPLIPGFPKHHPEGKKLRILYWNGKEAIRLELSQDEPYELKAGGGTTAVADKLTHLPAVVAQGRKLSHSTGVKGTYAIISAPSGVTLSADGTFTWTPAVEQIGSHKISYKATIDGASMVAADWVDVAPADAAGAIPPAQLADAMRIDLPAMPDFFGPGLGGKSNFVITGKTLLITAADGFTGRKTVELEKEYVYLVERENYYVAVSKKTLTVDLLDKTTFKTTKKIKFGPLDFHSAAIHPGMPLTYVALTGPSEAGKPKYKVSIVDESTGDVREPQNCIGSQIVVDPTGTRLYASYMDTYRNGSNFFFTPNGGLYTTPTLGSVDILLTYDLDGQGNPKIRSYKDGAGDWTWGIRLSSDGKRLAYLSVTGYPKLSNSTPAWDPSDLEKKPVGYEVKEKGHNTKLAFHPQLPIVIIPSIKDSVIFFGRETADEEKDRAILPAPNPDIRLHNVFFAPDGKSAMLLCERDFKIYLSRLPLKLSAQELEAIKKFTPPAPVRGTAPIPKLPPGKVGV